MAIARLLILSSDMFLFFFLRPDLMSLTQRSSFPESFCWLVSDLTCSRSSRADTFFFLRLDGALYEACDVGLSGTQSPRLSSRTNPSGHSRVPTGSCPARLVIGIQEPDLGSNTSSGLHCGWNSRGSVICDLADHPLSLFPGVEKRSRERGILGGREHPQPPSLRNRQP